MELRNALDLLPADSRRVTGNVHVPFVMVVLRIADYLQIHAERAPGEVLQIRALRSPLSRAEWNVHHSIREVHCTHDDPEAIYVAVKPASADAFARIRKLLTGIQHELDASWAVLGESYGRFGVLSQLGLTLRRLRSNIDNLKEFAKEVSYYPVIAAFETATTSLLKLLIRPLYGDAPEVGVRELLQNAVDAVRERRDLDTEFERGEIHVSVEKAEDDLWLTVKDDGVGMTLEVVTDYFLRAGASFRWSDTWRQQHTVDGKSRVLRSGRFGVGALAAFLIGDRIEVRTRHRHAANGIEFSASIDDEVVELRRAAAEVGTTVRVKIREESKDRLLESGRWDWYCLKDPAVHSTQLGKRVRQRRGWPTCGATLPSSWRRVAVDPFDDVQWSYWSNYDRELPNLAVNGIRVDRRPEGFHFDLLHDGRAEVLSVLRPTVSVFDAAAAFPLNLQRTGLTRRGYPFDAELLASVADDFVAWVIVNAPEQPYEMLRTHGPRYPGVIGRIDSYSAHIWEWFWCTPAGWLLSDVASIEEVLPQDLIVGQLTPDGIFGDVSIDYSVDAVIPVSMQSYSIRDANNWLRFAMGSNTPWMGPFQSIRARGRRLIMVASWLDEIKRGSSIRRTIFEGAEIKTFGDYVEVRQGSLPTKLRELRDVLNAAPTSYAGLGELFGCHTRKTAAVDLHPLMAAWRRILGSFVLPYRLSDRLNLIRDARVLELVAAHTELSSTRAKKEGLTTRAGDR